MNATIVAAGATILAYKLSGKGLALFAGLTMVYISMFGQWKPSMQTLSFILVAVPLSLTANLCNRSFFQLRLLLEELPLVQE